MGIEESLFRLYRGIELDQADFFRMPAKGPKLSTGRTLTPFFLHRDCIFPFRNYAGIVLGLCRTKPPDAPAANGGVCGCIFTFVLSGAILIVPTDGHIPPCHGQWAKRRANRLAAVEPSRCLLSTVTQVLKVLIEQACLARSESVLFFNEELFFGFAGAFAHHRVTVEGVIGN